MGYGDDPRSLAADLAEPRESLAPLLGLLTRPSPVDPRLLPPGAPGSSSPASTGPSSMTLPQPQPYQNPAAQGQGQARLVPKSMVVAGPETRQVTTVSGLRMPRDVMRDRESARMLGVQADVLALKADAGEAAFRASSDMDAHSAYRQSIAKLDASESRLRADRDKALLDYEAEVKDARSKAEKDGYWSGKSVGQRVLITLAGTIATMMDRRVEVLTEGRVKAGEPILDKLVRQDLDRQERDLARSEKGSQRKFGILKAMLDAHNGDIDKARASASAELKQQIAINAGRAAVSVGDDRNKIAMLRIQQAALAGSAEDRAKAAEMAASRTTSVRSSGEQMVSAEQEKTGETYAPSQSEGEKYKKDVEILAGGRDDIARLRELVKVVRSPGSGGMTPNAAEDELRRLSTRIALGPSRSILGDEGAIRPGDEETFNQISGLSGSKLSKLLIDNDDVMKSINRLDDSIKKLIQRKGVLLESSPVDISRGIREGKGAFGRLAR